MPGLSKAQTVKIVAAIAVGGLSLLAGTPTLTHLLGPLAIALSDEELFKSVLDVLKEPARMLGGNLALSLVDRVAALFSAETPGPDEHLRRAMTTATRKAIEALEQAYQQQPHYGALAARGHEFTEPVNNLFADLRAQAEDEQFLSHAVKQMLTAGQLHQLVLGPTGQLGAVLGAALADSLESYDSDVVEFLQQRLASNVVVQLMKILCDNSAEGVQALKAFSLLELAWMASGISVLEQGQQQTIYLQWKADERLRSIDAKLAWLSERLADPEAQPTPAFTKEMIDLLRQFVGGTIAKPKVYVSSVWEPLRPYREAAVEYLAQYYDVLSDQSAGPLPATQRLKLVDECDLFVGIFGHKKSALPDPPLPLEELERALNTFRRCLILEASPDTPGLALPPPEQPADPGPEPKPMILDEPQPPGRSSEGSKRLWLTFLAAIDPNRKSPDQLDAEAQDEYWRRFAEVRAGQYQLDAAYKRQKDEYDDKVKKGKDLYNSQQAEYQSRIRRHSALLKEVEREFVPVYRFQRGAAQPGDDLVQQLIHGLDALCTGRECGFPWQMVLRRWRDWTVEQKDVLRTGVLYMHPIDMTSPVEVDLDNFLAQAWHLQVEELMQQVISSAADLAAEEVFDKTARRQLDRYRGRPVDCKTEIYSVITHKLSDWCSPGKVNAVAATLKERASRYKWTDSDFHARLLTFIQAWVDAANQLQVYLDKQPYGKCLLVMGGAGSGKTHLLARLLDRHPEGGNSAPTYCLYVPRIAGSKADGQSVPVEELLLRAARFECPAKPEGPSWRTFSELANFVGRLQRTEDRRGKLLIVLDDLDLWVRDGDIELEELFKFIDRCTNFHHIFWVLCLSEANYDLVSVPAYECFFRRYAFAGSDSAPEYGGWIVLDSLNARTEQWEPIIRRALGQPAVPPDLVSKLEDMPKSLLTNPFIAWIVGELKAAGDIQSDELPNLNYLGFAEKYWERRLEQALLKMPDAWSQDRLRDWLARATFLIGGQLLEKAKHHEDLALRPGNLPQSLVEEDGGAIADFTVGAAQKILDVFVQRAGILAQPTGLDAVKKHGNVLMPRVLPIWWWQSAEYLMARVPTQAETAEGLASWLAGEFTPGPQQAYLRGVLEFLILLSQQKNEVATTISGTESSSNLTHALVKAIPTLPDPYPSVVWLAAVKEKMAYQRQVADELSKTRPRLQSKADLHAFLYFLKYAEVTPVECLQILQPHYAAIQAYQYGTYLAGLLQRLVETTTDGKELARAFAYLYGIEPHLDQYTYWTTAGELAEWTYNALSRLAKRVAPKAPGPALHNWVIEFLATVAAVDPDAKEYDRHWILTLRCHCDWLARGLTVELLTALEKTGWFSWTQHPNELTPGVLDAMEEQLTVAAGEWFRKGAAPNAQNAYIAAVEAWARGAHDQARVAAFLIKHTIPAEGPDANGYLDLRLARIFKTLQQHPGDKIRTLTTTGFLGKWYKKHSGIRVYYAGPVGAVQQALTVACSELVDDPAQAQAIVLNGVMPEGEALAARVRAGAGLVLILGPNLTATEVGRLLGVAVGLEKRDTPLSLTTASGMSHPLLTEVAWTGAPQVWERFAMSSHASDLLPLVIGLEEDALILGMRRVGQGQVYVFTPFIDEANPQIQQWEYFNYFIYHLTTSSAGDMPLSFADYPA